MRVVLDTNVLISAFLWQRLPKEIFYLAQAEKIQLCLSEEILAEFQKVLNYPKFLIRLKSISKTPEEIVNEFLEIAKLYSAKGFEVSIIAEDPSDNKFLSCALSCGASFIISGDKHLLKLKRFHSIPVVSLAKFLKIIRRG